MNKHSKSPTMRPHLWGLIVAVTAALVCALAGPAYAEFGDGFGVSTFDGAVTTSTGAPYTQAGGHPFQMSTTIDFNRLPPGTSGGEYETVNGETLPDGDAKDIRVDLPPGLVGDPSATPTCPEPVFEETQCPATTQVGVVRLILPTFAFGSDFTVGVYNLQPTYGAPAEFGFNFLGNGPIHLIPSIRTGGDYGLHISIPDISQTLAVSKTVLTLWGVPADHAHDYLRANQYGFLCNGDPSNVANCTGGGLSVASPPVAFLSNPTDCATGPSTTYLETDSWEHPGNVVRASFVSHDNGSPPSPIGLTGCDALPFNPSLTLSPDSTQADAPTGARAIQLKLPQNDNPTGLAEAHLKEAVVSLPTGVTLNPGAADGLEGCTDAQIAIHSALPASCPNASVVGTAKVVTPLLEAPLEGQVFVGAPECSPCGANDARDGRLLRLFLQVQGSGVLIKAAGTAQVDQATGRLTVTFKELPQQPFSELLLTLKGGERAVFINPLRCGPASVDTILTPWSGTAPVTPEAGFTVDWDGAGGQCPATTPFSPGFSAGATNPQAGASSAFTATFTRPDRNQPLGAVSVKLPPGLLGKIATIPQCAEPQAADGGCSPGSRLGTARVAAGTGPHPYWFSGPVYLTTAYKGAPFGLSIAVPAVAGPFNLGTIVTRAAINVDPRTAQITVTSDPLPQAVDGIKTHLQTVNVTIDREHFMLNPTGCAAASVAATVTSAEGASANGSTPFEAANCASLPFKPKLSASTQAKSTKAGGASLDVKVTEGTAQANIKGVKFDLPKQLPSRLTTLQKACTAAVFDANPASCPAASSVGTATASTPILARPLTGPAYLVSYGGEAFPDLVVVLQGEGITVDLTGATTIKKGITSSTFSTVPDAPISSFELKLPVGPHSVLTGNLPASAKGSLCRTSLVAPTLITGQNGLQMKQSTKISVSGCPKAKKAKPKKQIKSKPVKAKGGK